ncbi:hypothetical protein C8J56DRAFT_1024158 [Mycena floridula]|nr:hypothetical protein C8J56DRAFT_1024158 [Mycena floridula]
MIRVIHQVWLGGSSEDSAANDEEFVQIGLNECHAGLCPRKGTLIVLHTCWPSMLCALVSSRLDGLLQSPKQNINVCPFPPNSSMTQLPINEIVCAEAMAVDGHSFVVVGGSRETRELGHCRDQESLAESEGDVFTGRDKMTRYPGKNKLNSGSSTVQFSPECHHRPAFSVSTAFRIKSMVEERNLADVKAVNRVSSEDSGNMVPEKVLVLFHRWFQEELADFHIVVAPDKGSYFRYDSASLVWIGSYRQSFSEWILLGIAASIAFNIYLARLSQHCLRSARRRDWMTIATDITSEQKDPERSLMSALLCK